MLTNKEIYNLVGSIPDDVSDFYTPFARAVIAAYEAKLRDQEPAIWMTPDGEGWRMRYEPPVTETKLGWTPLFLHPTPTQALAEIKRKERERCVQIIGRGRRYRRT